MPVNRGSPALLFSLSLLPAIKAQNSIATVAGAIQQVEGAHMAAEYGPPPTMINSRLKECRHRGQSNMFDQTSSTANPARVLQGALKLHI